MNSAGESRPPDGRRSLGAAGERLAARELERRGYAILARNVRLAGGEIDLVARHGAALVIVEVRLRRGAPVDAAIESITPAKQRRLRHLAAQYCSTLKREPEAVRIDVVAISLDRGGLPRSVVVIENAVEGE